MSKIKIESKFCELKKQNVSVEIELVQEIGNKQAVEVVVNKCFNKDSDCGSFECVYVLEGLSGEGKEPF